MPNMTSSWRYCPQREAFWKSQAMIIAADAGRSSGKSATAIPKFASRTCQYVPSCPHPVYVYCLPTYAQAERNVWQRLQEEYKKANLKIRVNNSAMRIEFALKQHPVTVYVMGMDKPHRLEGEHYCGIAVDEMSDIRPGTIERSILPALNAYHGWLMMLGVPKRKGCGALLWREICIGDLGRELAKQLGNFASFERFHWSAEEIYTPEEMAAQKAMMSEKDYSEQMLANWETSAGLAYHAFDRNENVFTDDRYDPNRPLFVCSDFNVSPMSWCIVQGNHEHLNVIDEISKRDTNTQETLDELYKRWGKHRGGFEFYGDAASKQRHTNAALTDYIIISRDRRFADSTGKVRVYYPKSNPAVFDRIASVNAFLRNASGQTRLMISSKCVELIKDLEGIAFKENSNEIDKSDPDRTHMSDALGYLIHYKYPLNIDNNGNRNIATLKW